MVRWRDAAQLLSLRSPLTRGDGPARRVLDEAANQFSPHTGGWSAPDGCLAKAGAVLPSPGGMVRAGTRWAGGKLSSPLTRGDGPEEFINFVRIGWFSPHTGGWSVSFEGMGHVPAVLPSHGGMVRASVH